MATIVDIQTSLGNTGYNARIVKTIENVVSGADSHYVVGGVGHAGRCRWCQTTRADAASVQATSIDTQLKAS